MLKQFFLSAWHRWFRDDTEELQKQRKQYLEKLIDVGVFHKIEIPGNFPHLWVKSAFHALDFDTKSEFVNVVYAYYVTANPISNVVVLFDSHTGNKIGKYTETYGGLRLE